MKPGEEAIKRAFQQAPEPEPDRETLLSELAGLSLIDYDKQRKEIARKLGCRPTSLDAEVEKRRPKRAQLTDEIPGDLLTNWEVQPWPEPVSTAELLERLRQMFARYVILPHYGAETLALWVLHAWAFDAARAAPFLVLTSPMPRCGKTRVITLLTFVCPRPLPVSNISPAGVFRSIQEWGPTLLMDEAETFVLGNEAMRGILNAGHTRTTAFVVRIDGDPPKPHKFSTWAPKVFALIGRLTDRHGTLADRSIILEMKQRNLGENVERLREDDPRPFEPLCRMAARWRGDHIEALRGSDPEMPEAISDRAADNWRSLVAIADLACRDWAHVAREAALRLSGIDYLEENSTSGKLLEDFRNLFDELGPRMFSETVADRLGKMTERPWPDFSKGRPITQSQVARLLKPFAIKSKTVRVGSDTSKGYAFEDFEDTFARYLPPRSVTSSQAAPGAGPSDFRSVTLDGPVTGGKTTQPLRGEPCDAVTDRGGKSALREIFEL
jgi:putative DNA primase/helicase